MVRDTVLKVSQSGGKLEFEGADEEFVGRYFSLDHDLKHIRESIGRDLYAQAAFGEFWGLRLIRQDLWECLASYICATYKSIAAIKGMLNCLAKQFGEVVVFEGREFFTFPTAEKLANASEGELADCGLGYRAKYLLETSKLVASKSFELERLGQLPYLQARKELCTLPGVGLKVADCVLLFSLGRLEAFPVDVWGKRVILNHYAKQESLSNGVYVKLSEFGRSYFGKYAGYAQEYLYHYERMHS